MRCAKCGASKLSDEFSTLRAIEPIEADGKDELTRYCLRCLGEELAKRGGLEHSPTEIHIRREIDYLDGKRPYEAAIRENLEKTVTITFMGGQRFLVPVNAETTVKDLKLFLGEKQRREPRYYRLMLDGQELKVRGEDGTANRLARYTLGDARGRVISAVIPYSTFAGQNHIQGASVDQFGNAQGTAYDLGVDGGFTGLTVAVLHYYTGEGFDFRHPMAALQEKGFTVVRWTSTPPVAELERVLATACQLWVISDSSCHLNNDHVACIRRFYEMGKGVYLWGDNTPYFYDANIVSKALLGNVYLDGNDQGGKSVAPRTSPTSSGFDAEHIIFTGIVTLFEGITIARVVAQGNKDVVPIMINSHGYPVTSVVDDGKHRLVLDGGFTRLFCNWDAAGTSRFVKNISAWLCGIDADWV